MIGTGDAVCVCVLYLSVQFLSCSEGLLAGSAGMELEQKKELANGEGITEWASLCEEHTGIPERYLRLSSLCRRQHSAASISGLPLLRPPHPVFQLTRLLFGPQDFPYFPRHTFVEALINFRSLTISSYIPLLRCINVKLLIYLLQLIPITIVIYLLLTYIQFS